MKLIYAALAALALAAAPAAAEDWTGVYAGAGFGWGDIDGSGTLNGHDSTFGLHLGYDYDFGDWVIGGELDYNWADIDLGTGVGTAEDLASLKFKAGYDFGDVMGYAVLGGSRAYTSFGNDTGMVYGVGAVYAINDQWTLSGEVLRHDFDSFNGTGVDADADVIQIRASFRF